MEHQPGRRTASSRSSATASHLPRAAPRQINAYVAKLAKAQQGRRSLGYGVSENSKLAAGATHDAIEKYSDDIGGAKVVYINDDLAFGLPNGVGPEVTAMKDSRRRHDLRVHRPQRHEDPRPGARAPGDGRRHDVPLEHLRPDSSSKDAGDLFEGDYVQTAFRPFEADTGDSDLDLFKQWMEKEDNEPVPRSRWSAGSTPARVRRPEGRRSASSIGPKVIAADQQTLDRATPPTGLIPPIRTSRRSTSCRPPETRRRSAPSSDCMSLVQVKDGEFEVVGDTAKPLALLAGRHHRVVRARDDFDCRAVERTSHACVLAASIVEDLFQALLQGLPPGRSTRSSPSASC